jgi:hypothetical protein
MIPTIFPVTGSRQFTDLGSSFDASTGGDGGGGGGD